MDNATAAQIRQALASRDAKINDLQVAIGRLQKELMERPKTPEDEINRIPGRRIVYTLVGTQTFTTAQAGVKGAIINMLVSQDGPFVMTHYPVAMWKPSSPTNATNFGRWRPVSDFPLPTQQLTTDFVSISYELTDSGSQRLFQNAAVPPILSRPDQLLQLATPTLFAPNSTIAFTPTYEAINFNSTGTATTGGTLVVSLLGYRIVNM